MSYFGPDTGLSADFDARLGAKVDRALARMTEGQHQLWCDLVGEHKATGRPLDIACAWALNEVLPGWRRFRKTLTWDHKPC